VALRALQLGIPCGGWCPKGRKAEDGPIPDRYPLQETLSGRYPVRTRLNVRDSDGTLILTVGIPSGGTALTIRIASEMGRPHLVVDLVPNPSQETVRNWITENRIKTSNVAGPRESSNPGIHSAAMEFLRLVFSDHRTPDILHPPIGQRQIGDRTYMRRVEAYTVYGIGEPQPCTRRSGYLLSS
jgi:hypothetical protein